MTVLLFLKSVDDGVNNTPLSIFNHDQRLSGRWFIFKQYMSEFDIGYFGMGLMDSAARVEMMKLRYSDQDQINFLGYFELTTVIGLINLLKNDMDIIGDDKEYAEIESFINGDEVIYYHYIYLRDLEDVSRQVPHSAPTNIDGHRPVYIDIWTKISEYWDVDEIKKSVRIIAKDFLGLNIENVEFIDIPTFEETKLSYEQDYKSFVNDK